MNLKSKELRSGIQSGGSEEANDGRRGEGIYQKVMHAMKLLKDRGLPFGVSTCYTGMNVDSVSSEEYFDKLIDCGALFAWFFHYMPVGNDASPELLLTPEQREKMYRAIRQYRSTKAIFTLDFQNDAEFVGGCIAGGRRYLHINANGDIDPCVFIHYSNANIYENTLLEALKSPIFMHIMPVSRLMKICFVHARCLRIRRSFVRWLKNPVRSLQICSLRSLWSIFVRNVMLMQNIGHRKQRNYFL